MDKKILALLSALILIVYPMTAYAIKEGNAATPVTFSVNYVVSTNTLFTVETASASPEQTAMNFTGGRNKPGVEPEGQDRLNSTPKPWATITNLGEVNQDFKVSLDSANPPSIQLIVNNLSTMPGPENMVVTTTPSSPSGWTNIITNGKAYLYAEANFINAPDGRITKTLKIEGAEHSILNYLAISPATAVVKSGSTQTFTAIPKDQFGNTMTASVTWSASGDGTISQTGPTTAMFTAETTNATITAEAIAEGVTKTATAEVEVYIPTVYSITVSPANPTIEVGSGQLFTAILKDQKGNTMTGPVVWSSSDISVGTIEVATGGFTAVGAGTTTIKATVGSIEGTTTVTVPVPPPPPPDR